MDVWMRCINMALRWRHNDLAGVSNHQPHGCLLNRLFRRRSNKTSKLRVTGLCVGNSPGPVNSPHKGPVTRKMFPFDDVIMDSKISRQMMNYIDEFRTCSVRWIISEIGILMMSWHGNTIRINDILCGESATDRQFPTQDKMQRFGTLFAYELNKILNKQSLEMP